MITQMFATIYFGFYVATTVVVVSEYRSRGYKISWDFPLVLGMILLVWPMFLAEMIDRNLKRRK